MPARHLMHQLDLALVAVGKVSQTTGCPAIMTVIGKLSHDLQT